MIIQISNKARIIKFKKGEAQSHVKTYKFNYPNLRSVKSKDKINKGSADERDLRLRLRLVWML